ncbi:MAG: DUF177 domain-containing protein [Acidimicrobiia bacterium]|nr:DUF177 domain-containing protein [Acidimicrobiia bacterium]
MPTGVPDGREPEQEQSIPARLRVNVADLRKRLGQRQVEPIEVILPRLTVLSSRTTNSPVIGEVTVESIERGVAVYGQVSFGWEGDCRRCLEVTDGTIAVDLDEIFQVNAPEDSDIIDFDGDQIDLVPMVRDAVGLSLPLAPLCGDDCAGPDPERYPALVQDIDTRERDEDGNLVVADPRWAGLDQLDLESN